MKFSAIFYLAKVCTDCRNVDGFDGKKAGRSGMQRVMTSVSAKDNGRIGFSGDYSSNGRNLGGYGVRGGKQNTKRLGGFLKPGTVLYMLIVDRRLDFKLIRKRIEAFKAKKDGWAFWVKFLVPFAAAEYFIVIAQKDLGSGLPLAAMAFAMLLVSGVRFKTFVMVVAVGLALAVFSMVLVPHRRERLKTFFSGKVTSSESSTSEDKNKDAETYHINNALIAIGSGGLFGVGIGNNVQTAGYLPESITDSMFAVIGETIGFVGILVVLFFYYMLLSRMLKVADCTKDSYYQLVTIGVFAWLAGHVVVNITAMTGLAPVTGIPLPLLSKGGTSLIMNMAIIGLVLNISQYTMRADVLDAERRKIK